MSTFAFPRRFTLKRSALIPSRRAQEPCGQPTFRLGRARTDDEGGV